MAPHQAGALTFLFTDIEGSTSRWEHQHAAMAVALERHDALLRPCIEARGGHVFKTVGDAFYAAFGDAAAAVAAAVDAQRALAAEDWRAFGAERAGGGEHGSGSDAFSPLRVRMGIHTGVAQARGGDHFGPALNRTARLVAAGHGGQVLLSLAARQAVGDALPAGVSLRDLGEHRLKDLRHAERIWQVVAMDLPDVTRAPTTAGELGARDRIVVLDPTAVGGAADDQPTVVARTVGETLAALRGVVRRDTASVVLTIDQVRQAAMHRSADLETYRLGRIAEWSLPRYRLDGRFVELSLLMDQGELATNGRWLARPERFADLGELLAIAVEPAVVVLGPPGSGKSTLLRRLELDTAIAALRGGDAADRVTFFAQLSQYRAIEPGQPPPAPARWLARRWAERQPDLPALDALLARGRVILLLDALNEMPAATDREYRALVGLWKDWLVDLARTHPGNRVVFSCRTLDYSAPLSTPALRVPQVQIEPLSDRQVEAFLRAYSPMRGADIWAAVAGTPQLEALRAPFFLALLVDQVEASGDVAGDRAGLFTGFVRQALRREVERGSPLFALDELLASRDIRRITQWQWRDAYELPERGALMPRLAALAYGMQEARVDGEASQVRVDYDAALALVDHPLDEDIVKAGLSIAVLDEDPAADEVLYRHQLIQEYFAARVLAREPRPELVATPWRAADVRPDARALLATLPPAETLPPLPTTGWEETMVLAAAMATDAEDFVRGVMATNLALAGRCAALFVGTQGRPPLAAPLIDDLRRALVARTRAAEADLRARIAAGLALGALGDPRFERRDGPYGPFAPPPLITIAGGVYPIGDDDPFEYTYAGDSGIETSHMPRHGVPVAAFAIGAYPVTNAEYACFVVAGGYDDDRWWDTVAGQRWRRGELANEAAKANSRDWRRRFVGQPELFEQMVDEGRFPSVEVVERWRRWMTLDTAGFEAALAAQWQPRRLTEPQYWRDGRFDNPAQPVVGISWYEARAYATWLGTQTGQAYRLPTEVELEAAARGPSGTRFAYGEAFDAARGNTYETHVNRPTPVGVFVEGDTPAGVSDLAGNVAVWTSSQWGSDGDGPDWRYPYDATDGREAPEAAPDVRRVVRGGSWLDPALNARAAFRFGSLPVNRNNYVGVRLACSESTASNSVST